MSKNSIIRIQIYLTYECNFQCAHCYVFGGPKRKNTQISDEKLEYILEFLDELQKKDNRRIIIGLTGGEPTLHPKFSNLVEELLKRDIETGVLTNGSRSISIPQEVRVQLSTDKFHASFKEHNKMYPDFKWNMYKDSQVFTHGRGSILYKKYQYCVKDLGEYCFVEKAPKYINIVFDYQKIRFCDHNAFNKRNKFNFVEYDSMFIMHPQLLLKKSIAFREKHSGCNCPVACNVFTLDL